MGLWFILRGAGLGVPFVSPTDGSLTLESHALELPSASASENGTGHTKTFPLNPIPKEKPGTCCTKE
jgi:hypothetical protein